MKRAPGVRYSIVITSFNQQEFIQDALESVLAQGNFSMQVIVVDDGSQDNSLQILKRYEKSVELVALPVNCGVNEARNRGASLARGEYLIFLDGDDLFTPWALEIYEQLILEYHPTVIMSGALWFDGTVPVFLPDDVPKTLGFVEYESLMAKDRSSGIYSGAFVINRIAFQDAGGWSPGIWHLDGHDLCAKLAYSGRAILVLSPYTMLYRMHAGNSIRSVHAYGDAARLMMDKERSGQYPGRPRRTLERYARHGGVVFFCVKRLWRAGLSKDALLLAVEEWRMIVAAITYKSMLRLKGRRPIQTRAMAFRDTACHHAIAQNVGRVG